MKLTDLVKKIIPSFNVEVDKEQKRLEQGVAAVQNIYEQSESQKEANKKAMDIIINTIQTHPEMPVGEFLKMVQKNTDLSDTSLVEIMKQIPDIKSEKAIVDAVKKVDLATEAITEIIHEAPVSPVTAQKLAEQIPDEEVQKKQQAEIERKVKEEQRIREQNKEKNIISKLENLYNRCSNINDAILVDEISKLNIEKKTEKINEKIKQIISKKVAIDCMDFGGPKLPTLMKIIPATEMLEIDLPNLVEKEYQKAKVKYDEDEKKYYKYDGETKKMVKGKILENIAKEVASNFEEIGDISIPQIEALKNLNEDEIKIFVNAVKKPGHQIKLGEDDVKMVERQLRGGSIGELENLQNMLGKMKSNDRERAVSGFIQQLKVENNSREQKELDIAILDIGYKIRRLPEDKQLDAARAISDILDEKYQSIESGKKHPEQNHDKRSEDSGEQEQ
mgnify:CR=1 FL=1